MARLLGVWADKGAGRYADSISPGVVALTQKKQIWERNGNTNGLAYRAMR